MYFLALATDYDGTIAHDGRVDVATCDALKRLKDTGRRLLLVTGRELPDLRRVFSELELFDCVVAENGALLYDPATQEERVIAPAPPRVLVRALEQRGVAPLSVGQSIVATWTPHETTVLEVIRDLGLELQIIFNKGAIMILPPGINKASGLAAALKDLGLSAHNVVAVGDAENDHAFLAACGCSAAVDNALPMLKRSVDIVLEQDHGRGVAELIERISAEDSRIIPPERHGIQLGADRSGGSISLQPRAGGVLIAGSSGIGKSTLATALTERMAEKQFEFCIFDPEGDYVDLDDAVSIGTAKVPPDRHEVLELLQRMGANVAVNTQALEVGERPAFFAALLPELSSLRARTGRPHWLLIDEAHHLLPAGRGDVGQVLPEELPAAIMITVHPDAVAVEALRAVQIVLALGPAADTVIATFCERTGAPIPADLPELEADEILMYAHGMAQAVTPDRPRQTHKRHTRKYAEGELEPDRSFYFRGPDKALNLRAQNLTLFLQIADGVDERTWEHHRGAGDYSNWLRRAIKDESLAREVAAVETDPALDAQQSRRRIREIISSRYTAPAKP